MRTTQTYHTSLWFWLAKSCRLKYRLDIHADRKYSANFNSFRGKQKKIFKKKDATGEIGSLATKNLAPCVVVGQLTFLSKQGQNLEIVYYTENGEDKFLDELKLRVSLSLQSTLAITRTFVGRFVVRAPNFKKMSLPTDMTLKFLEN